MRERARLTQDELIEQLSAHYKEIAKPTISSWENGRANPPIEDNTFIEALAIIFNVTVADVLKGSGYNLGVAYEDLDDARRRLLEAYDSGDLERLVREALMEWDKKERSQRLDADGDDSADVTRAARR